MKLQHELRLAEAIAHETGQLLLSYFGSERIGVAAKGARDVVTAADLAAERHAVRRLREAFPGDGVVAEEGSRSESVSGRRWYLDPLDGTMNFSREIPVWCVSLGLFHQHEPIVGVIHDPVRAETFAAAHGAGARCNGRPIRVSGLQDLSQAFVHLTIDFNDESRLWGLEDLTDVAPRVMRTRNIGSAALALAYVAAGRLDAMLHRYASPWDYMAGVAIVAEAGGFVTDLDGAPFGPETRSLVAASSQSLHAGLLDLIRRRGPTRIQ